MRRTWYFSLGCFQIKGDLKNRHSRTKPQRWQKSLKIVQLHRAKFGQRSFNFGLNWLLIGFAEIRRARTTGCPSHPLPLLLLLLLLFLLLLLLVLLLPVKSSSSEMKTEAATNLRPILASFVAGRVPKKNDRKWGRRRRLVFLWFLNSVFSFCKAASEKVIKWFYGWSECCFGHIDAVALIKNVLECKRWREESLIDCETVWPHFVGCMDLLACQNCFTRYPKPSKGQHSVILKARKPLQ